MAMMPEEEFRSRLEALKRGQERIQTVKRELMKPDVHYGVIPGTDKPTLYKPGAEVLCSLYSLRADFTPTVEVGDGELTPHLRVSVRSQLHLGDLSGPVVAVGHGAANSWESKHRYRREGRVCPECGTAGSVIKGKEEYGGGWICWARKGGCGAKFADGAPAIVDQVVGNTENPDPFDLENTLVKMAEKRAFTDVTLRATASSDLFTQDVEDLVETASPPPKPQGQSKAAGQPEPARGLNEDIRAAAQTVEAAGGVVDDLEAIQRGSAFFGKKHRRKGEEMTDEERWESDVPLAADVSSFREPSQVGSERWRRGALRNLEARLAALGVAEVPQ
jgi:hypothetical protein